jgi:HD superfamily phosphohydrolase
MFKKQEAIRDPIHKWIKISAEEKNLIDSPYVQRLRWVSQLTSVDHVFPGGTHNRFSHSLGVCTCLVNT